MPNTQSAKRQLRINLRRRARNKAIKSRTRTFIKKLRKAIEAGDKETALKLYPKVMSEIDRAIKKGVFHDNKGSRYKSRLTKKLNVILKAQG